jgi:hypothetical protein
MYTEVMLAGLRSMLIGIYAKEHRCTVLEATHCLMDDLTDDRISLETYNREAVHDGK